MCSFTKKYIFWIQFMCVILSGNVTAQRAFLAATTLILLQITNTQACTTTSYVCKPSNISFNINSDVKIGFQLSEAIECNNWVNKTNLFFYLKDDFDESRYFRTGKVVSSGTVYFTLTVKIEIKSIGARMAELLIYEDVTRSVCLNKIPIYIKEIINNPPLILPSLTSLEIRESLPIGSVIKTFTVTDPDTGVQGQLVKVYSDEKSKTLLKMNQEKITLIFTIERRCNSCTLTKDIPDELEISNITNDRILLKTRKELDAEKYINYSKTGELNVERGAKGPVLHFTLKVKDKLGLESTASVNLTIVDVGDEHPTCNSHQITVNVSLQNTVLTNDTFHGTTVPLITSLQEHCYGRNYVNNTVSYSLVNDTCNGLNIATSGEVTVEKSIDEQFSFCVLLVQATDATYTTLTTDFTVQMNIISCPADIDNKGNYWKKGSPGIKTTMECPEGNTGTVTRYCGTDGQYSYPVYNCTSASIANIEKEISGKGANVVKVLDELANTTSRSTGNSSLFIGDMDAVNRILSKVTEGIDANTTEVESLADTFMETVNNILDEDTSETWTVMIKEKGSGADSVLDNIDVFVDKIMANKNTTVELRKTNIYLKTEAISSSDKNVKFPSRDADQIPSWASDRLDQIVAGCNDQIQSFSGVMYRNVSKIISSRTAASRNVTTQINAPVMSLSFYPMAQLQADFQVEITFQLYDTNLSNASCSFWTKANSSSGYWSDKGCRRKQDDLQTNTVTCVCNHLTNFAVLMSPSDVTSAEAVHRTTLNIISLVGCIISMICLFITSVVHIYFWRFVRSVRSILHMNLSCTLFLAYALFLAGVERTEIKDLCTAVAALLHLLYLIVFLIMLTEGLHLAHSVLMPLSHRKPGVPLLIASYVTAIVIVAVSMGVVKMEGYGNENFCWLSTESGLIWAFIAPVLFIILINVVVIFVVIWKMCNTTVMSRRSNAEKTRTAARSVFILMPILGVTWVFGVFSVNKDALVFQYLFSIFNSLQGALIFYCHCVKNQKIREAFRQQKSKLLSSLSTGSTDMQKITRSEYSSVKNQTSAV